MKTLVIILVPISIFSLKVGVYSFDPSLESLVGDIEEILKEAGYDVLNHDSLKVKFADLNGSDDLRLVLIARILGLDELFLLLEKDESIVVKRLFVKPGEFQTFLESNVEDLIDDFKGGLKGVRGETPSVEVKLEEWEKGRVYKRGDLVKHDGEVYRSLREHVAMEGNEPGNGEFWEDVGGKVILGYFPSWAIYGKGFSPDDVDVGMITHLAYAFANVMEDGRCVVRDPNADLGVGEDERCDGLGGNFTELLRLKGEHPDLKVLISVGGWNWSRNFSKVASDPVLRRRFVKSCVETFVMGNFGACGRYPDLFDGIDIDWEFPVSGGKYPGSPDDRENFTKLVEELREALDEAEEVLKRSLLLSIAGGSDEDYIFENTELAKLSRYLDFVIVMTYDFYGSWSEITGFHNALYPYDDEDTCVDTVVKNYIKAGVPPEKILLGIPLYGRSWSGG